MHYIFIDELCKVEILIDYWEIVIDRILDENESIFCPYGLNKLDLPRVYVREIIFNLT